MEQRKMARQIIMRDNGDGTVTLSDNEAFENSVTVPMDEIHEEKGGDLVKVVKQHFPQHASWFR
jgi:hypothetical protein